jgi:hypothetical protein
VPRVNVRITWTPDRQKGDPEGGIRSEHQNPGQDFVSPDGQFILTDLAAGQPLQVSVTAPGYQRFVMRRVLVQPASEAVPVDFNLVPEDATKWISIAGKLLNAKGEAVGNADLRLLVATDRPAKRDESPIDWRSIESDRTEQFPNVLQVRRLKTKADGSFLFERVPGDAAIELAYWAIGILRGRIDRIDAKTADERSGLIIKALAPARIVGVIDRKVFPQVHTIELMDASGRWLFARPAADGKSFHFDDLPPGQYDVRLSGPSVRSRTDPETFIAPLIGRRQVTLPEPGEVRIELGIGDKLPDDPQP